MTAAIASAVQARTARLGTVYDRLLILTAGERAYRNAGNDTMATTLAAERLDILTELTRGEAEEMLLVAIGRAAPVRHLCSVCGRTVSEMEICQACQDTVRRNAQRDTHAQQRTSHQLGHLCPACAAARAEFDAIEAG